MKLIITILLFLLFQIKGIAQDSTKTAKEMGLDEKHFRHLLNQQFSSLTTGLSKTALGSFIALDLKETEVSAAGSLVNKNGSTLVIKAAGGVSDGLYSIFSNSKFNTKVSLDVQYNFLSLLNRLSLSYYDESYREYKKKKAQIEYDAALKEIAVINNREKKLFIIEKNKLEKKQDVLKKFIDSLNKLESTDSLKEKIDSAKYEQDVDSIRLQFISTEIAKPDISGSLLNDIANARGKERKKIKDDIEIAGFRFGWFSIGYNVKKNEFKLFNPAALFNEQITDTGSVSHEVRLQYAYYKWSATSNESYFLDGGIAVGISDNFSDLEKKSIQETKETGSNPGDRSVINSYNAYEGGYKKKLKSVKVYADAYKFFARNNAFAIHVFPELKIKDEAKPVCNFGAGLVFSIKDAKDETSIVNAELYYNALDLFNTADSDKKLFERNDIGLRFTFPIKFKTTK